MRPLLYVNFATSPTGICTSARMVTTGAIPNIKNAILLAPTAVLVAGWNGWGTKPNAHWRRGRER